MRLWGPAKTETVVAARSTLPAAPLPTTEANLNLGSSLNVWRPLVCHPVIAAACNLADSRLRRTPLKIVDGKGQERNPPMWLKDTWLADAISMAIKSLWLTGNLYGAPVKTGDGRVADVELIAPARISVHINADKSWEYKLDGKTIPKQTLHHVRYSALPGEPIGLAAISASALNIEMGVSADEYLVAHLRHGPKIGVMVKPERELSPARTKTLKAALESATVAPEVAWRPLILSGVEITQFAYKMDDAQYYELASWGDSRLCTAFNIDPSVLGVKQDGGSSLTYQNVQQRDQLLWADSLSGLAARIEQFLTSFLPAGLRARFDDARWMLGGIGNRAQVAEKLALLNRHFGAQIITGDEIRDIVGLPPAAVPAEPVAETAA